MQTQTHIKILTADTHFGAGSHNPGALRKHPIKTIVHPIVHGYYAHGGVPPDIGVVMSPLDQRVNGTKVLENVWIRVRMLVKVVAMRGRSVWAIPHVKMPQWKIRRIMHIL